jgi:translation initiation factor IF-2
MNLEKMEFSSIKLKKFKNRRERRKFYGDSKNILKIHEEKEKELKNNIIMEFDEKIKAELTNQLTEIQNILTNLREQKNKVNPIIIKVNETGKLHAIQTQIEKQFGTNPGFSVESIEVGPITQSDVEMALEMQCKVFLVDILSHGLLENELEENNIKVKNYQLVHELLDDLKELHEDGEKKIKSENESNNVMDMGSMKLDGKMEVKMVFRTKLGKVAGVHVVEGKIKKEGVFRVIRNGVVVGSNLKVQSLKKVKTDVEMVKEGQECGVGFENFYDFRNEDVIECYALN